MIFTIPDEQPLPPESQDAAELHRVENVSLQTATHLSGAESKQIDNDAYNFMYYNVLRDAVGVLHADWNERGQAWIRDIKAHMERFRVKDGGGRRALIDTQIEHTKSMTQDEIAAWKRALTTPSARIKSAESDIKKHNAELNRKIEQALKLGLPEDGEVITRLRAALKGTV